MESAKAKVYVKKVSSAKTLAVTLLLLAGTLLAGCGDTLDPTVEELQIGSETLPIYRITKSGATEEEARTLAAAAGLEVERTVDEHGVVDFFDPKRYQFIPTQTLGRGEPDEDGQATTLEAFDFEALEALQVPEGDEMQALLTEALAASGLLPGKPFDIEPTVQHSTFVAADEGGEAFLEQRLDTRVSYRASLNGLQVIGLGAIINANFDTRGITKLRYAFRQLEAEGEVEVVSPKEAQARCRAALADASFEEVDVRAEYVYYVPSLNFDHAKVVLPHIACSGVARAGSEETNLLERVLPAVKGGEYVPSAQLEVAAEGARVTAALKVEGGAEPYRIAWRSANVALPGTEHGEPLSYIVNARQPTEAETLTAIITDANGISAEVSETFAVEAQVEAFSLTPQAGGTRDFGTENAVTNEFGALEQGFIDAMLGDGVTKRFSWTGKNAWERDFKSPNDGSYIDNTDISFYVGHGFGGGFTFEDNTHDDGVLNRNDADGDWGDNDLEWLALLSCQVLRKEHGGDSVFDRWKQEFDGLHLLLGFHTNAYTQSSFSGEFAKNLVDRDMTVRQAWFKAVDDAQPDGVDAIVMGVMGEDGTAAMNDHFWGKGSVSADIRGGDIRGYWYISHIGD